MEQEGSGFGLLVLTRKLLRGLTLAYVPFGPAADPVEGRGGFLSQLAKALRRYLPPATVFLRYDLPWEKAGEAPEGLRKCPHDIQPSSTVLVDLTLSIEEILGAMKPKTRYNIRLAAKRGVTVNEGSEADIDAWYELYRETGRRDRIAIHSKAYYAELLAGGRRYSGTAPVVKLLLARAGGELLAGNLIVFWKSTAVYLTGASSSGKRNLMPTYALQWEAIRAAKEAGCSAYDLYGVPSQPDPGHPMYGLYQFKTGFSPRILRRWGAWDVPYSPIGYAAYTAAERARLFYFRTLKKRVSRQERVARAEPAPPN